METGEGGWWGGHLKQAGLLPQGTQTGTGGPDAIDLQVARLTLASAEETPRDFHPEGWFSVSVSLPMYGSPPTPQPHCSALLAPTPTFWSPRRDTRLVLWAGNPEADPYPYIPTVLCTVSNCCPLLLGPIQHPSLFIAHMSIYGNNH